VERGQGGINQARFLALSPMLAASNGVNFTAAADFYQSLRPACPSNSAGRRQARPRSDPEALAANT